MIPRLMVLSLMLLFAGCSKPNDPTTVGIGTTRADVVDKFGNPENSYLASVPASDPRLKEAALTNPSRLGVMAIYASEGLRFSIEQPPKTTWIWQYGKSFIVIENGSVTAVWTK